MSQQAHVVGDMFALGRNLFVHQTEAHRDDDQSEEEVETAREELELRVGVAALRQLVSDPYGGEGDEAEICGVEEAPAAGGSESRRPDAHVREKDDQNQTGRH